MTACDHSQYIEGLRPVEVQRLPIHRAQLLKSAYLNVPQWLACPIMTEFLDQQKLTLTASVLNIYAMIQSTQGT